MSSLPSDHWIWSARWNRVGRIQRLVGIHLAGGIGVARHLPAGQVDRLQAGLHLLHGLVAGQGAEGVDVGLVVHQLPQLVGAAFGQGVLDRERAAQADDVGRGVVADHAFPARVAVPFLLQFGDLLFTASHDALLKSKT